MKLLVHDYAGHPFQAQLSRSLADRGHVVVHSYCAAYGSGKGRLESLPGEALRFEPIGVGFSIAKMDFGRRLIQEIKLGFELVRQIRRERPDVVMVANAPIPTLSVMALFLMLLRTPWVLWHQDVQAVAIRSFAGEKLSRSFRLVADGIEIAERWCARRAAAIVVISDGFLGVHDDWGTAAKTTVIPNWAPVDEIVPVPRDNAWSTEVGLDLRPRLVYSGTLGLKHNPALLPQLAARARQRGVDAQLVIVNEGPAQEVLRTEAERLGVDLVLLPFQPYERLSEVLGSADVLVVLLEKDAGVFSVPSKTLSYLCAGRPVLGMMPSENLAAGLVEQIGGCVVSPEASSLDEAAAFVADVTGEPERALQIGKAARDLAEREFGRGPITDRFEQILTRIVS
ncbi:MAG: glycosyltransferase family 4 protein [Marmoricola sp.]